MSAQTAHKDAIDRKTREAIRSYQRELNMKVDGEPSLALLDQLRQVAGNQ